MRAPTFRLSLLLTSLLLSGLASAQELTLFEPVDSQPQEAQQAQPQFMINQNGQPAFTVRGVVRVGDAYRVSLVNREGLVKQLEWLPGERTGFPGLPGYEIVDVKQRSVVLNQPQNDPCVESPVVGVRCNGQGQAVLSIATAAPLPPDSNVAPQVVGANAQFGNGQPQVMGPQNPFEAAIQAQQAQQGMVGIRGPDGAVMYNGSFAGPTMMVDQAQLTPEMQAQMEARNRARAERMSQFQPTRIPDDQIPQGMRRVSTPFGDRLIPERE